MMKCKTYYLFTFLGVSLGAILAYTQYNHNPWAALFGLGLGFGIDMIITHVVAPSFKRLEERDRGTI